MQFFFNIKFPQLITVIVLLALMACSTEMDGYLPKNNAEQHVPPLFSAYKSEKSATQTKANKTTYTTSFTQDDYIFEISVDETEWDDQEESILTTKTNWGNTGVATTWAANDAIGIYMRRTDGVADVYVDRSNVKYTTTSTAGSGSFTSAVIPEIAFPRNSSTKVDFMAYYPYAQFGGPDTSLVQFSSAAAMSNLTLNYTIPTNQTGTLIESADLMYATNLTNKDKTNPAVNLTFTHALTMVTLAVKSTAFSGITLTKALLRGTKVTNTGTLLIDAPYTFTPNTTNTFSPYAIINKKLNGTTAVYEDFIINPCTVTTTNQRAQMELVLTIGNIDYTCPMPAINYNPKSRNTVTVTINNILGGNVKIAAGSGGTVQIGDTFLQGRDTASFSNSTALDAILTGNTGWIPFRATYDSSNPIELSSTSPQTYTIPQNSITSLLTFLFRPTSWYPTDSLQIHYDGIYSGSFGYTNPNNSANLTWYDLSGHTRHGSVKNINYTATSGWSTNALWLDGTNDRVDYSGVMWTNYTMNFVINIRPENQSTGARLNGDGPNYHSYYLSGSSGSSNRMIALYSSTYNGIVKSGAETGYAPVRNQIIQCTMVYNGSTQIVKLYVNGVYQAQVGSIPNSTTITTASLGGTSSNYRLKAGYYSYMLYNRVLSDTEIQNLYTFNKARFGMP